MPPPDNAREDQPNDGADQHIAVVETVAAAAPEMAAGSPPTSAPILTARVYRFNYFDPSALVLRDTWSKGPHAAGHVWARDGENRQTDSSAFDVIDERKLRGTAKPGCKLTHTRHAAHEKIAADLAALLDLPIPPVTLYHLTGALPDCPHKKLPGDPFVAISVWPFLCFEEWGDRIVNKMTEEQKKSRAEPISAMWVFESWISAQDRGAKHTIVNSALGNGPVALAFIDWAHSMSMFWATADAPGGAAAWFFGDIAKDEKVVRFVADQVQKLGDADISEVVTRIPADWLPDGPKSIIVSNLLTRKTKIDKIVGL